MSPLPCTGVALAHGLPARRRPRIARARRRPHPCEVTERLPVGGERSRRCRLGDVCNTIPYRSICLVHTGPIWIGTFGTIRYLSVPCVGTLDIVWYCSVYIIPIADRYAGMLRDCEP
ncbi:hypothetical protein BHE74_00055506 [Ensete ventricosum]|nr:hypothetical protein BHE74_00055506 [Ensete ventricosum]